MAQPLLDAEADILANKIKYIFNTRWELDRLVRYLETDMEIILRRLRHPADVDDLM